MVKVKPTNNQGKISIKTNLEANTYSVKDNMSEYYAKQAENWAHSEYMVDGIDYSAKYYANKAQESVDNIGTYKEDVEEIVNSFEADVQTAKTDIENARVLSIQNISNTCASFSATLDDVISEKTQDFDVIFDSKKEELETLNDEIIDNCKDIINRVGLNMFDTVLKDHILTYEESKGLALQGTYVYKEAVAGSRYGYPDFYSKCLEEYENSSNVKQWVKSNVSYIGSVVDNEGIIEGFSNTNYVTIPKTLYQKPNSTTPWEVTIKLTTSSDVVTTQEFFGSTATTGLRLAVADNKFKIWMTSLTEDVLLDGVSSSFTVLPNTTYWYRVAFNGERVQFYYSLDNIEYISSISTALRMRDHFIVGNTIGYAGTSHFLGTIDLNESYITVDGEGWWTGTFFAIKNPNGHLFYDIADKDMIDSIFESTGMAWMYGVDEENERIFLPRNVWFEQMSMDEVGQSVEAGLPNIEGALINNLTGGTAVPSSGTGALKSSTKAVAATKTGSGGHGTVACHDLIINASDYNQIYGNSDTVQPPAVKKLLYICVGNTVSVSSVTDVVEVTTTENDTTPLFTGMYFDFKPNNVSWLKGGEQANSGGVYTFCYNELVNELTTPKYGLKVINEADMIVGVDYSEYWKVNQDDMTFTTPTAISNKALSGAVKGNGMALGLTDGTNYGAPSPNSSAGGYGLAIYKEGYGTNVGSSNHTTRIENALNFGITTDPTKSGIIAEQATAQLYFKVANAVQNLELLDVGRIEETLATKLDRGNKQEIINWGMPDYTNIITVSSTPNTDCTYTAPSDGLMIFDFALYAGAGYITINGIDITRRTAAQQIMTDYTFTIPINKNDVIGFYTKYDNETYTSQTVKFVPLKGAN